MATPDQVTKADLDTYVAFLFSGIIDNYDNFQDYEKAAINQQFGRCLGFICKWQ